MLFALSPIFVVDTKIIFGYNLVAPLTMKHYTDALYVSKVKNDKVKMTSVKSFYYFIRNFEQVQHNDILLLFFF